MCAPLALIAGVWAAGVFVHTTVHGFSWTQAVTALFLAINILVCAWEMILYFYADEVVAEYTRSVAVEKQTTFRQIGRIFSARQGHAGLSPRYWAKVWAYYARLDRSYIDRSSFGFIADTGNGFSTLVPSIFTLVMMTWQVVPAQWLGIVILASHYQMAYGAVAYFFAYILNRRGRGHRRAILFVLVGLSNSIWIVLPAWSMVAAVQMILSGTYSAAGL
ncbi:hypothetical protein ACFVMC_28705 [Nocardia sp. NPDC127579]|uniref:hypothetical protein n=1 Tax=Nocardia sp. NPDC127579 TaxID=3345402 RepID=UPI003636F283